MFPGSCAQVLVESVPLATDGQATRLTGPTQVGLTFANDQQQYVIDSIRLEILPPSTGATASGITNPQKVIDLASGQVAGSQATNLAVGARSFTINFNGTNAQGGKLADGIYPVVYSLQSSGAPHSQCSTDEHSTSYGELATIDWEG